MRNAGGWGLASQNIPICLRQRNMQPVKPAFFLLAVLSNGCAGEEGALSYHSASFRQFLGKWGKVLHVLCDLGNRKHIERRLLN